MRSTISAALAAALLLPLSGCGDSSTEPLRLTRDEVGGVYQLCSLSFAPTGDLLPVVDVRAAATNSSNQGSVPPPALRLGLTSSEFQLEYAPKDDVIIRRLEGTYSLGTVSTGAVTLDFSAAAGARALSEMLLPDPLRLSYQAATASLVTSGSQASYTVARADYARLANRDETNLPAQIEGRVSARFLKGSCG